MSFYKHELIMDIPEKVPLKIKQIKKLSELPEQYRSFLQTWLLQGMPFDNIIDIFAINQDLEKETKHCIAWFQEKIMILSEQKHTVNQIILSPKDVVGVDYFSSNLNCQIGIKYLKDYAITIENIQYDKTSEKWIEPIFYIILGNSTNKEDFNNIETDCTILKQVAPEIFQSSKLCYHLDKKILNFYWSIKYGNENKYTKQYFIGIMNKGVVLIDWSIQNTKTVYIFWENIEDICYEEVNEKENYIFIKTDLGKNYFIPVSDEPLFCPFCFVKNMESYLLTYGAI